MRNAFTKPLINHYFSTVKDLKSYLLEIILPDNFDRAFLVNERDSEAYHELLKNTHIALNTEKGKENVARFRFIPPAGEMGEIIDRAQEILFKRHGKPKPVNMITYGYRSSTNGDIGKKGLLRMGIANTHLNTIVTVLTGSEWELLLQRIGVDVMLHLLTETSAFISLPNDCYCQIIGTPLFRQPFPTIPMPNAPEAVVPKATKRKLPTTATCVVESPKKRLRYHNSTNSRLSSFEGKSTVTEGPHFSPVDIAIVRARLFYSRPTFVPGTNQVAVGLPPRHVLNRLVSSFSRTIPTDLGEYVDPDPRKQADNARHLAKYIFPIQYRLSSPFTTTWAVKYGPFKFPDYTDREGEIKGRGRCLTPKRLKEVLPFVEKMIWRHQKAGYKALRDLACPSKIKNDKDSQLNDDVILELMSERSIQLCSQPSGRDPNFCVDSSGIPILPMGSTQAQRRVAEKPRFVEFACSHTEVFRFAALVTNAVIPKAFWGNTKNFKLVLKQDVKFIISSRRNETTSMHSIMQGFRINDCDWVIPGGRASLQSRVSVTDALKRRELCEEFLFWYFDSFLIPLLKTTFYITESSAFRKRVLYFRQDDWKALCAPLVERLTNNTFQKLTEVEANEVLRQRTLGFSFVRLLPKDTGVRPIVNLRRKKEAKQDQQGQQGQQRQSSINQILQAAFHVLSYEKRNQPELLGSSVFGQNGVHEKFLAFKQRLSKDSTGTLPKLYFVKLDVQACYDTIEQGKLLEILRGLISEDSYVQQRYGRISTAAGRINKVNEKKAFPADDHPHFIERAAQLAGALWNTIFVDQVQYPVTVKSELLQLLEEHITDNIVKIGKDYFRQVVGIPQGSILSALLCSFFYGDLEKRFGRYTEDPQSVLLRYIDDYLFVTTSLSKARSFLEMMKRGHPEYGCFISQEKTMTNFDHDVDIMNVIEPMEKSFPWCGYLINMSNLSITVDYTRYKPTHLTESLTVDRGRNPGVSFKSKMFQLARAKSQIVFCDPELNGLDVVYFNSYQNFLLSAMKMHGYITNWIINRRGFLKETISELIELSYTSIRNAIRRKKATSTEDFGLLKTNFTWLGIHAFYTVLSHKPTRYKLLLPALSFELSLPKYKRSRERFKKLVKEGLLGMRDIAF